MSMKRGWVNDPDLLVRRVERELDFYPYVVVVGRGAVAALAASSHRLQAPLLIRTRGSYSRVKRQ